MRYSSLLKVKLDLGFAFGLGVVTARFVVCGVSENVYISDACFDAVKGVV